MMKSILSTTALCLCTILGAQAQIKAGNWYNGWLCYSAEEKDNGVDIALNKTASEYGRFSFASEMLLNTQTLRKYDKKTLRIMRNEIMARHGYVFQSKDLRDYFSKKWWYKPAANNNAVKLNVIEQTNVELIKSEETLGPGLHPADGDEPYEE